VTVNRYLEEFAVGQTWGSGTLTVDTEGTACGHFVAGTAAKSSFK